MEITVLLSCKQTGSGNHRYRIPMVETLAQGLMTVTDRIVSTLIKPFLLNVYVVALSSYSTRSIYSGFAVDS
jgi:hypothetical protein